MYQLAKNRSRNEYFPLPFENHKSILPQEFELLSENLFQDFQEQFHHFRQKCKNIFNKCCSFLLSVFQSFKSFERSISSAVQNSH